MKTKQCEYDDREKIRGKRHKDMSNPDNVKALSKKCGKNGFSEKENLKRVKQFQAEKKISYSYIILIKTQSKVKLRRA